MENKIIITNYSSSFGEHEYSLYSLRKSIQGLSRSQRQKYQSHGDAWWTLRIHPLGTTRFFSPDQSVDTSQPTEHPTQNHDIDLVVAREEKWEDRQTKSGGFILWGTWIHPIEEVKSWRCPAGDRTNHLSFSVYQTLTSTNQINSWRAFRPDESAERRQKTSFPESFFVVIDLMLKRLR